MNAARLLRLLTVASLLAVSSSVLAEEIDLGNVDLSDLLNMKTSVATKTDLSTRETPGIVSIITDEEIKNMGARDLIDVLRLVPSIDFGNDVEGIVDIGIRGMWAHEGKFLLLIDGIEMNDLLYASNHFGNEFPVNQIKRIEIIRGPGSAIYGGFAELAVISIITKKGADYKGAQADVALGRMQKGSMRNDFGLAYGGTQGDWDYSVAGYAGQGKRGEGLYTGFDGTSLHGSFDYKDADTLEPGMVNAGLSGHGFNFRFVHENYRVGSRSQYGFTGSDMVSKDQFRSWNWLATYDFKAGEHLKITPGIQYLIQEPWQEEDEVARALFKTFHVQSQRLKANTFASYDISSDLNVLGGFEYITDHHQIIDQADSTGSFPFSTGKTDANFDNRALIAQGLYKNPIANVTAGLRYEAPGFTKASFVPRLGFTHAENDWHAKLLYSQAFRTPVVFNIDPNPGILPEHTETAEIELGHKVTKSSYVTLNLFTTRLKNAIVYFVNNNADDYANFDEVGTHGVEADFRLKKSWGQTQLAYSWYEVTNNNVDYYRVDTNSRALLGMPQNKIVWNTWYNLGDHGFKLNPTIVYVDRRYAFEYDDAAGAMVLHSLPALTLANLFIQRDDVGLAGLNVGLGVFNIFNNDARFIQPYNGGHSPAPGPSREVAARIEYTRNF
jgi:outer membrane cobalamin receptor